MMLFVYIKFSLLSFFLKDVIMYFDMAVFCVASYDKKTWKNLLFPPDMFVSPIPNLI